MSSPKRLGNTVFSSNDPLDDLRPARQKKLVSLPSAEPAEAPVAIAEAPESPANDPVTVETSLDAAPEREVTDEAEEVLDAAAAPEPAKPTSRKAKESNADPATESPPHGKVRFSANVSNAVKQRAENAAYWVPGLTISAITEVALEREIRRLEKEFNAGKPFEKAGKLKYGRPRAEG
jgi:hypothetical protein